MFLYKNIKLLFTEFIYGGHLPSLGISGLILTIILLFNLPIYFLILIIPYLGVQIVYLYNHFREIDIDTVSNPERTGHLQKQIGSIKQTIGGYIVLLVILLLFTNIKTLIFILTVVLGGILYTNYFKKITKKVPGFKNFYTAFFLALSIFLVPLFYELEVTSVFLYLFLLIFLRMLVNTTFFDIKDIESDKMINLKTLPVIFGKKRTIYLLQLINLISAIPLILGVNGNQLPRESIFLIISVLYSFYYLSNSLSVEGKNLRTLTYIIADAEYIFWPIIISIGKIII